MGELHRTWGNKSHSQDLKTGWSREDSEPVEKTKENANNAKILGAAEEQEHKLPLLLPTLHVSYTMFVVSATAGRQVARSSIVRPRYFFSLI